MCVDKSRYMRGYKQVSIEPDLSTIDVGCPVGVPGVKWTEQAGTLGSAVYPNIFTRCYKAAFSLQPSAAFALLLVVLNQEDMGQMVVG